jgi:SAM-dependent methyltransferase/uncharacterized protein YbaR (Trm112 family)
MRLDALDHFVCPADRGRLSLAEGEVEADGHVITGRLHCTACGSHYVISQGVPNFIDPAGAMIDGKDLTRLQRDTIDRFGWEWQTYRHWGWLEHYPDVPDAEHRFFGALLENTRSAFRSKTLIDEDILRAAGTILDAGCGNGRFTNIASEYGATVIGVDLGAGAYVAFEHMRHKPNVHIARGDLFRLPLRENSIDFAFSIGVLMHTGDARAALTSISSLVRPGGRVLARVYGKGLVSYEIIDRAIRAVITRLPLGPQVRFAALTAGLSRFLRRTPRRRRLNDWLFQHINLLPTEHHMFDWWAAPIATHHTVGEVVGWLSEAGYTIVRSLPAMDDPAQQEQIRGFHGAITVLAQRNM